MDQNNLEHMLKMEMITWEALNQKKELDKRKEKELVKVNRLQQLIKQFREKSTKVERDIGNMNLQIKTHESLLKNQRKAKKEAAKKEKFPKKSTEYFVWRNPKHFEDVLEKKTTKFSFGKSKNQERRREIDALRREKMMREDINNNLESEIEQIKEELQNLNEEVGILEDKQQRKRQYLLEERRKCDNRSAVGKVGLKQVAERLQEENQRTRQEFFEGVKSWGKHNKSGLGGSTYYNSGPIKPPTEQEGRTN